MIIKNRKGTLALVVAIFFLITMLVTAMLLFSFDKFMYAKRNAEKSANDTSYFSLCNILANGFKSDFEGQWSTIVTGDLLDINKSKEELYNEAIKSIQDNIIDENKDYQYKIEKPQDITDKMTELDKETHLNIDALLENSQMKITIDGPISYTLNGTIISLNDINFKITLTKGTIMYTQSYVISDEIIQLTQTSATTKVKIDSSNAKLTLTSQNIEFQ